MKETRWIAAIGPKDRSRILKKLSEIKAYYDPWFRAGGGDSPAMAWVSLFYLAWGLAFEDRRSLERGAELRLRSLREVDFGFTHLFSPIGNHLVARIWDDATWYSAGPYHLFLTDIRAQIEELGIKRLRARSKTDLGPTAAGMAVLARSLEAKRLFDRSLSTLARRGRKSSATEGTLAPFLILSILSDDVKVTRVRDQLAANLLELDPTDVCIGFAVLFAGSRDPRGPSEAWRSHGLKILCRALQRERRSGGDLPARAALLAQTSLRAFELTGDPELWDNYLHWLRALDRRLQPAGREAQSQLFDGPLGIGLTLLTPFCATDLRWDRVFPLSV